MASRRSPTPLALRNRAIESGLNVVVSYGSTESTALVAAGQGPDVVRRPNSAGRVLPNSSLRISSSGEILVGGPSLFLGYRRQ